ncbi:MAG: hypothetical protein ACOCWQ_00060 [Nanoarchaeota archaeon]
MITSLLALSVDKAFILDIAVLINLITLGGIAGVITQKARCAGIPDWLKGVVIVDACLILIVGLPVTFVALRAHEYLPSLMLAVQACVCAILMISVAGACVGWAYGKVVLRCNA